MGWKRAATSIVLVLALVACGGGGDDESSEDTVALEDIEPIVDVDPCDLLDADTASELSGGDVADAETEVDDDGTVSCEFAFADEGDADAAGSAIAASLTIGPGDEDDVPGGALARSLDMGDAAAVEEEEQKVRVVYIVREVVVTVEVAPATGEVTPELVDQVIDFTETTEAPITEAVTGEDFEEETTTTTEASTTTSEATTSTTAGEASIGELWGRNAVEFRDRVGEQFEFDCPGPAPEGQGIVWGTGIYTDDSSVCWAAVHAGIIEPAEGGTVPIEMRPGQAEYQGTTANGVETLDYGEWPGSYVILGAG